MSGLGYQNQNVMMHSNATHGKASGLIENQSISMLREKDAHIVALQKEITALSNKLSTLYRENSKKKKEEEELERNRNYHSANSNIQKRSHKMTPYGTIVFDSVNNNGSGKPLLCHERSKMGRNASIATANELRSLTSEREESIHASHSSMVSRILEMFKDPTAHVQYLNSNEFAKDILKVTAKVRHIFENEPRVTFLQSPCYVFGDIHGNLEDLHFFADNIWRLGISLTAGNFLFLGDYVDRGMNCLECVAYLFALKLLYPDKIFLLRGNHETRDVNGWEEHYGKRSFIFQCRDRFGDDLGFRVWEQTNQVFDRLPLAAVIDQDVFCVHGGIPRPIHDASDSRIQDILSVPKVAGVNPPYEHENDMYQQVASDCIWSDPASEQQEKTSLDPYTGYGESLRGGGAICFGHKAVNNFLSQHGFSYIMRAHEAHAEGVAVSKGGKVFTIFSTSKDHNQGEEAMAGCILVDFEKLQVINRSPAYRNQYVHRRDSSSIALLTEEEIQQRERVGLITAASVDDGDDNGDVEFDEEWDDIDDDSKENNDESIDDGDDVEYALSNRRSSVDPSRTRASPDGSDHDNHVWKRKSDEELTSASKRMDFTHVETLSRKQKRELIRFSMIQEVDETVDDEESTLDGTEMMDDSK